MSSFFRGLLESLSPRTQNVTAFQPALDPLIQSKMALLEVDVATATANCDRIEQSFDAVTLGVYKSSRGTTYYDTAAELEEAQQTAATNLARIQHAADGTSKLLDMYNSFVPWVLKKCRSRIQEINKLIEALDATAAADSLDLAREQAADIIRALQCLDANVREAQTFLGKVGKTEEGAHDAGEVELAGADMIEAATARWSKQKRTRPGTERQKQTNRRSGSTPRLCDDKAFFQRQRGAFCGVCAINNMMGRRELSYRQAELLADSIWLRSVLSHGCGVHFPAPRLHSRRREFPYDGFIDFATMHELCLLHGLRLRELSRTNATEVVKVMRNGLGRAARQDMAESSRVVPLLLVLLGSQKHYVCLCARRAQHSSSRNAGDSGGGSVTEDDHDADWDDLCRLCGRTGELICCDGDGCTHAYHARCIHFQPQPDELWLCPNCRTKKTTHTKMGSNFVHEAELVWMDSQLERPISERILAVDRRAAGRNAALFDSFAQAARGSKSKSSSSAPADSASARMRARSMKVGRLSKNNCGPDSEWDKEHEFVGERARHYLGGAVFNGTIGGARLLASVAPSRRAGTKRDREPLVFRFDIDGDDDENQIGFIELEQRETREAIDAAMALKFHNGTHRKRVRSSSTARARGFAASSETKLTMEDTDPNDDAVEDLRKLLHPSSPEQIVVFAVEDHTEATADNGLGFGSLFDSCPKGHDRSQLFAGTVNPHKKKRAGGASSRSTKQSGNSQIASPQLWSIASGSPFRDAFRLE
eukprot:SAG31_NODE_252_length_19068_cov_18.307713_5_plen_763_part_00